MGINRNLVKSVATIVGTATPVVMKYLKQHPEITQSVQDAVTRLLARRSSSPDGMLATIAVLSDQVDYLKDSADDAGESAQAQRWAQQLTHLERAVLVLKDGASRKERKSVHRRLLDVRGQVLAAFIAEQADDAGRARELED